MNSRFLRWGIALAACVCACVQPAAGAALSPEVTRGLAWLQAQVKSDGSVVGEAGSVANVDQVRGEVALALAQLTGLIPDRLASGVSSSSAQTTEQLTRKALVKHAFGAPIELELSPIIAAQNEDGGLADIAGYASSPLVTAYGMTAVCLPTASQDVTDRATSYLVKHVQTSGTVFQEMGGDVTGIEFAGNLVRALTSCGSSNIALEAASRTAQWMVQQQSADGSWKSDSALTALSILGLQSNPSRASISVQHAQSWLLQGQRPDGSWQADPFVTALALRALSAVVTAPPITSTSVIGRVVAHGSNVALPGTRVVLSGGESQVGVVDSKGVFNLSGLVGGEYQVTVEAKGYLPFRSSVHVPSGMTVDVGTVTLSSETERLVEVSGLVRDGSTGLPLSGVRFSLSGSASSISTLTDGNGNYRFATTLNGALAIAGVLSGYQPVTAAIVAGLGDTFIFSPQLFPLDTTVPNIGHVTGKVLAEAGAGPLPDVGIYSGQTLLARTEQDGSFAIDLNPGSYTIQYKKLGYQSAQQSFVLSPGARGDAGVIRLALSNTTRLEGRIQDGRTGLPLPGATVRVIGSTANVTVTTNAQGSYAFGNLEAGDASITVTLSGYNSVTLAARLAEGVVNVYSPELLSIGTGTPADSRVIGKVVSAADGALLQGVAVYGGNNELARSAASGAFSANLLPGAYTLTCRLAGYLDASFSLLINEGGTADLGLIRLQKQQFNSILVGSVRDKRTDMPIVGAMVALSGTAGVRTDANGQYRLELSEIGTAQITVSATGYLAQAYGFTITTAGDLTQDFALSSRDKNSSTVSLLNVSTDKSVYGPDEMVSILVSAASSDEIERTFEAQITIEHDGTVINYQDALNFDKLHPSNQLVISAGGTESAGGKWLTGFSEPGVYKVSVGLIEREATDTARIRVIDHREFSFAIVPFIHVRSVTVTPYPRTFNLKSKAAVPLLAKISNSSNLDTELTIAYTIVSPSKNVVASGEKKVALRASEAIKSFTLDTVNLDFSESGMYSALVRVTSGADDVAIISKPISVAPGVRIEAAHGLLPAIVAPDGAQTIAVTIKLKGVDEK